MSAEVDISKGSIPIQYLVAAYVAQHSTDIENQWQDSKYPLELDAIIVAFVGNLIMRFDLTPQIYQYHIKHTLNGSILTRPPYFYVGQSCKYISCSSTSFKKGKHKFDIKCIEPADDAIGIISNIHQSLCFRKEDIFWGDINANMYYYYGGGQLSSKTINGSIIRYNKFYPSWSKGDVIQVEVDCDNWTVSFQICGYNKQSTMDIEPNCIYYPMLATQNENVKYQLIYHKNI